MKKIHIWRNRRGERRSSHKHTMVFFPLLILPLSFFLKISACHFCIEDSGSIQLFFSSSQWLLTSYLDQSVTSELVWTKACVSTVEKGWLASKLELKLLSLFINNPLYNGGRPMAYQQRTLTGSVNAWLKDKTIKFGYSLEMFSWHILRRWCGRQHPKRFLRW